MWIKISLAYPMNIISCTNVRLTEATCLRCLFIGKKERKKPAFVDKKSIKKDTEWKLWPLEKIFAMYFCGNKHLQEMSLSLFSFQFSKGGL